MFSLMLLLDAYSVLFLISVESVEKVRWILVEKQRNVISLKSCKSLY